MRLLVPEQAELVAEIWPRFGRELAEIWPRFGRDLAEIWPRSGRDLAETWPRSGLPPEQVDPALPPTLSSDGWDVEDGGGLACSSGAAAARNVSSFLAAHPEVTRPAALATARLLSRRAASALPPHAQPLARGLRAAGMQ